jgi:hypothetical protein
MAPVDLLAMVRLKLTMAKCQWLGNKGFKFFSQLKKMTISKTPVKREIDFLRLEDLQVPSVPNTDFTIPSIAG